MSPREYGMNLLETPMARSSARIRSFQSHRYEAIVKKTVARTENSEGAQMELEYSRNHRPRPALHVEWEGATRSRG